MEAALLAAAVLACPVGMGVMMWMMMRGARHSDASAGNPGAPAGDQAAQIDALRSEIEELKAERAARRTAGGH